MKQFFSKCRTTFIMAKTCARIDFQCATCIHISRSGEAQFFGFKNPFLFLWGKPRNVILYIATGSSWNITGVINLELTLANVVSLTWRGLWTEGDFKKGPNRAVQGMWKNTGLSSSHKDTSLDLLGVLALKLFASWLCTFFTPSYSATPSLMFFATDTSWPQDTCHNSRGFSPKVH